MYVGRRVPCMMAQIMALDTAGVDRKRCLACAAGTCRRRPHFRCTCWQPSCWLNLTTSVPFCRQDSLANSVKEQFGKRSSRYSTDPRITAATNTAITTATTTTITSSNLTGTAAAAGRSAVGPRAWRLWQCQDARDGFERERRAARFGWAKALQPVCPVPPCMRLWKPGNVKVAKIAAHVRPFPVASWFSKIVYDVIGIRHVSIATAEAACYLLSRGPLPAAGRDTDPITGGGPGTLIRGILSLL